jgi:hypothetical protein
MTALKEVSDRAKDLVIDLSGIVLIAVVAGVLVYGVLIFIAFTFNPERLAGFRAALHPDRAIGMPACALAAYAIVVALLHSFPPAKDGGEIKLVAFGLEFTGPAGPITLWLLCFLAFVASLKWLRP